MKCPGFEQLVDYFDGHISGQDAETIAAHLAVGCRRCGENFAWYKHVRAIAAGDDSIEPPAWVLKRALQLFDAQARPRAAEHLGRLVASLVFDSFARPVLSGVRLAEMSNRQLLYRADKYSVDVQIVFSGQASADLIGQVLRESEYRFESVAGLSLKVIHNAQTVCSTATNAVGEFTLNAIAHGEYDLWIETGEGTIIVPRLPISPRG